MTLETNNDTLLSIFCDPSNSMGFIKFSCDVLFLEFKFVLIVDFTTFSRSEIYSIGLTGIPSNTMQFLREYCCIFSISFKRVSFMLEKRLSRLLAVQLLFSMALNLSAEFLRIQLDFPRKKTFSFIVSTVASNCIIRSINFLSNAVLVTAGERDSLDFFIID